MIVINSKSPTDAWIKSHEYLLENGNKDVMNESINMSVEIEDNFDIDPKFDGIFRDCLLYTSPSPRDGLLSRMPSSA